MKGYIKMITTGLMMTFSVISNAQGGPGMGVEEGENLTAEERAQKRTEKMKTELTLTETQFKEIYQINLAHILQMDKYREEQKALKEKVKAEREATRTKIKGVLTPEQNVIFDQKVEEHKEKQEQKRENIEH